MIRKVSLDAIARELLAAADRSPARRAARTVAGGHDHTMRQTVVALPAGSALGEHDTPGEATLYVISGRVQLTADPESWQVRAGDLLDIPPQRHTLQALEDSAVLLTAVPREYTHAAD